MSTLWLGLAQEAAPLRRLFLSCSRFNPPLTHINSANLARSGHSVFLIEAGGDNGDNLAEQVPAW